MAASAVMALAFLLNPWLWSRRTGVVSALGVFDMMWRILHGIYIIECSELLTTQNDASFPCDMILCRIAGVGNITINTLEVMVWNRVKHINISNGLFHC